MTDLTDDKTLDTFWDEVDVRYAARKEQDAHDAAPRFVPDPYLQYLDDFDPSPNDQGGGTYAPMTRDEWDATRPKATVVISSSARAHVLIGNQVVATLYTGAAAVYAELVAAHINGTASSDNAPKGVTR